MERKPLTHGESPLFIQKFLSIAPNSGNRVEIEGILSKLVARYSTPNRHYHNLIHLENGLKEYFQIFDEIDPVTFFAWAYHDVEYQPLSPDNEAKSAGVFLQDSGKLGFTMEVADAVSNLILETSHTGPNRSIVNDMDLSILGEDSETYDTYARNIRQEYSMLSDEAFNLGRIQVLSQLLSHPYIFQNALFRSKFEEQARKNIKTEIEELTMEAAK